jgi:hypothetical protein
MIAFHANGNLILQQAFKSKSNHHYIAAYNAIMLCLTARGLSVDLQILDNEASTAYKEAITFKMNTKFQLVPSDMHHSNRAECAIFTFKDHFLAILARDGLFSWMILFCSVDYTTSRCRSTDIWWGKTRR